MGGFQSRTRLMRLSSSSRFQFWASQVALVIKNLAANAADVRDEGSVPGLGRSHGGGHGNPVQYSCLGNLMDRGAWQAAVQRVANSQTQVKQRGMHTRRIQCQAAMSMKLIPGGSFPTLGTRNFNLIKPMAIVKERKSSVNPLLKLGEMQLPIPCFTS